MDQKSLKQLISKVLYKKLNPLVKTLEDFKSKFSVIDKIEESVSFLSTQYDDLLPKLSNLETTSTSIIEENICLKSELQKATNDLQMVKQELNNAEHYSRRDCLEIRGIPLQRNEICNNLVKKVGDLIGVKVDDHDISVSHRLPGSAQRQSNTSQAARNDSTIIVKFVRRDIRDKFYSLRKNFRGKSTKDIGLTRVTEHRIFIGESLTKQNRRLFNLCLEQRNRLKYRYIWTSAGRIFLRKDESSPVISVLTLKDLEKITNE